MFATHYKTNEPLNLSLEEETMLRNKTSSRIPAVELQYTVSVTEKKITVECVYKNCI
jgi:hypothetical protein